MLFTDLNAIEADFKAIKTRNYYKIWEPFMRKYNCQRVCELGVFKGDNFMNMIAHGPKLAVAVDSWRNEGVHSEKDAKYSKKELEAQFEYFRSRVNYLPFVQIIVENTAKAAERFPNNYFDFVYIDADHSVEGCTKDIVSWYPKVKYGKFLVGHDYRRGFGVVEAVNKFVAEKKLKLMFLAPSTWAVVKV
ncbi:MAG: class I SAM-dependent methyltransferase [Patescibacteria group bacterium]|nr:class I SAM-dependent methyltransferase [Patescibacteria group bacterium]MCX7928836.1 class I SAM-dependent methyltransferase [Patescibacteria group bacterium]